MTLNQLAYFEKIAETGNMGLAASLVHISQPSLSVAISNLEQELNVTLFNRIGRKLFLTLNGQEFLKHTKKILSDIEEAQVHMRYLAADKEIEIRIGCISPVLYDYLPRNIREFEKKSQIKDLKFNFIAGHTHRLIEMLKDGYFDFLLCSRSKDSEINQKLIFSEPFVLLSPPASYVPQTWNELLEQNLIEFQEISALHQELKLLLLQNGIQPSYVHKAPDEESIASLVSYGYGYAICPFVKFLEKMNIQITPLPKPNENFIRGVYLTQLINRPPIGVAKRFFNYLTKNSELRA